MRKMGVAAGLAALAALAGCAIDVHLQPGPYAADPMCAEVVRAAPEELSGQEQRSTTAQATLAWGSPPITLRCGVEVLGPTTEQCITIESAGSAPVDWVMRENGGQAANGATEPGQAPEVLRLTTFGRSPAIEVTVPPGWEGEDHTAVLAELSPAVTLIEPTRACL